MPGRRSGPQPNGARRHGSSTDARQARHRIGKSACARRDRSVWTTRPSSTERTSIASFAVPHRNSQPPSPVAQGGPAAARGGQPRRGRTVAGDDSAAGLPDVMTAYGTGLRISEALALETGDIDAHKDLIHVRRGKGGRERFVVLPRRLLESLREYWRVVRPPGLLLFPGQDRSKPLCPDTVRRAVHFRLPRLPSPFEDCPGHFHAHCQRRGTAQGIRPTDAPGVEPANTIAVTPMLRRPDLLRRFGPGPCASSPIAAAVPTTSAILSSSRRSPVGARLGSTRRLIPAARSSSRLTPFYFACGRIKRLLVGQRSNPFPCC